MSKNTALAAKRVAKKFHAEITSGRGPAVVTANQVVAITTGRNTQTAMRQLKGYRRRVYIAATDSKATKAALAATQGTTIGVIDHQCRVCKPSTRKTTSSARNGRTSTRSKVSSRSSRRGYSSGRKSRRSIRRSSR